jgi:Homing endonuclease associated repeat/HNH endonuclease
MQFKLNEYKQGVSNDELLNDVKKIAETIGDQYLSLSVYKNNGGKFSETTFRSRLGSWTDILKSLGLRTERTSVEMKRISTEVIIADLQRVAKILNRSVVTSVEYESLGKYSFPTIRERFGSWTGFISMANLDPTGHVSYISNEDLFVEIERLWVALGKQPTTTEMKNGIAMYSLGTFTRRFGGWRNALQAFLEYVEKSEDVSAQNSVSVPENTRVEPGPGVQVEFKVSSKKTPRGINVKLRFTVLQGDRFRCRSCGASPARNPDIELHVDHIIPWSKGGETETKNLQTLCSTCNFGKSNAVVSSMQADSVASN